MPTPPAPYVISSVSKTSAAARPYSDLPSSSSSPTETVDGMLGIISSSHIQVHKGPLGSRLAHNIHRCYKYIRSDRTKSSATNPNNYHPSLSEDIFVRLVLIRFIRNTPCCGAAAHSPRKVTVSAYNCQSQLSTHTPWAIKIRVQCSFCFWGILEPQGM